MRLAPSNSWLVGLCKVYLKGAEGCRDCIYENLIYHRQANCRIRIKVPLLWSWDYNNGEVMYPSLQPEYIYALKHEAPHRHFDVTCTCNEFYSYGTLWWQLVESFI
eukprot:c18521_g1_i1 orf=446-763(+)